MKWLKDFWWLWKVSRQYNKAINKIASAVTKMTEEKKNELWAEFDRIVDESLKNLVRDLEKTIPNAGV